MNEYTIIADRINRTNMGDKVILKGDTPFEAIKNRFPFLEIIEVQEGDTYDVMLIRCETDRFNRTFLKPGEISYFRINDKSYSFRVKLDNPVMAIKEEQFV